MSKDNSAMYPNLGETHDPPPAYSSSGPTQASWWMETWSNKLSTVLAVALFLCGIITAISVSPSLILGGILQVLCSLVILAIEAPIFVPCLGFVRPVGDFIDNRPHWVRATLYAVLTIFPYIMCAITTGISIAFFFILGTLCSLGVCGIYARLVLGVKANRDQMRAGAGGGGVFP